MWILPLFSEIIDYDMYEYIYLNMHVKQFHNSIVGKKFSLKKKPIRSQLIDSLRRGVYTGNNFWERLGQTITIFSSCHGYQSNNRELMAILSPRRISPDMSDNDWSDKKVGSSKKRIYRSASNPDFDKIIYDMVYWSHEEEIWRVCTQMFLNDQIQGHLVPSKRWNLALNIMLTSQLNSYRQWYEIHVWFNG